jgi:NAD(P)H dehydrogenase (quinone)
MTKVKIVFYSMYGHIYRMAEAVAEGVRDVPGADAILLQVPELVGTDALVTSGAAKAREAFAHVPVATPDDLVEADAVILGTPTRFGNMCAQMRNFLDQTGRVWTEGKLIGKVGSVFTSSATQHGGQESTLLSTHITLLHHGMLVAGIPFSATELRGVDEVSGGSPYGASTIVGDGKRQPSERELRLARFQGRHVAQLASRMRAVNQ